MNVFFNDRIHIDGTDWIPVNTQEIENNLSTILEALYIFNFYVEPSVLYSGDNLSKLVENLEALSSVHDYPLTNPIYKLRLILRDISAIDWNVIRRQKSDHNYYYITDGGASTRYVKETTIAEAAEYKFNQEEVLMLKLLDSEFNQMNPIHVSRSSINPPPNIQTIPIDAVSNKTMLTAKVKLSQKKRTYNWNPKHGEFGKGMKANKGEDVSPLLGSRAEAALLLNEAVGYRKTDELYAFDIKTESFMVFKCEYTIQNSYHSYHPLDQNEVDEEVKSFLLNP